MSTAPSNRCKSGCYGADSSTEKALGAHGISYILREDTWGNGYATEAANTSSASPSPPSAWSVESLCTIPGNEASGRVLTKVGFKCSACVRSGGSWRVPPRKKRRLTRGTRRDVSRRPRNTALTAGRRASRGTRSPSAELRLGNLSSQILALVVK
ncbi:GNAT family N-acetyltransferase [Streptomyces sioyaensis]|uniref:GNAT family N-acetyltransferase n=1 Tax=Streptomyces sioyaensis TaxID=67364 RepID=UPI0035ABE5B3|nr:GNAT family N-acetyltransferase [Streptomyces sioyaensis]